ncbi:MAG: carbohydrate kinase family protein, partial [Candidatus Limnocylindrales bacterium]
MTARHVLTVAGAFGIDTNVYPAGERVGAETTFAHTTDALGGAGCYSALAAAALGLRTRAIAAIGDDRLGAWIREDLANAGVELTELRDPGGTHRSVNIVDPDGSRRNYFDPRAASETVVDAAFCRRALVGADVVHVHLDDWCRRILPLARASGAVISCDLQDASDVDDHYRADFVAAADVIFLSAANLDDPGGAALELARRRAGRVVVVGAGADGCLVALGDSVERYEAVDLADAPVVDTNGAGDNLAIGFLRAYILGGLPPAVAVRQAQLGARWICAQRGDRKQPVTPGLLAS